MEEKWKIDKGQSRFLGKDAKFLVGPKPDGIRIGRVWGALSWPGVRPGYLLLMAQADNKDGRPLYLVNEVSKELTRDLVKAAADLQEAWKPDSWWHPCGDPSQPFLSEAWRALDGIDDSKRPSFLDGPDYPPEYALSLLKKAMLQEHLKLHLDLGLLMDELTQLSQAEDPIGKLPNLPGVRALLLILGAVERAPWPPRDYSNITNRFALSYSKRL
jgi:hypothetical protein